MFGDKEKKIAKWVKRGRWTKVKRTLEKGDSNIRVAVAAELANTNDDNSFNSLIQLLNDRDENVRLQAVKSLGILKQERAKTHLQNMISSLPAEKTELINAARESIANINDALEIDERIPM